MWAVKGETVGTPRPRLSPLLLVTVWTPPSMKQPARFREPRAFKPNEGS